MWWKRNKKKEPYKTGWAVHDPDYIRFDGSHVTSRDKRIIAEVKNTDKSKPIMLNEYRIFSMAVHLSFQRLTYATQVHETNGTYFGISKHRAYKIGQALTNNMKYFGLELTTTEENAFMILSDEIKDGISIDEVCIVHKSLDEVTTLEAIGIAKIITKLRSKSIHIWAGEYEEGALGGFCDELSSLNNNSLIEYDICDTSKEEPEDKIIIAQLDDFLSKNQ
ncbi:hypothetical protein QUF90_15595 [Desulfococcaceae bacterium HSG9]|nr:hypothetical protein [Desulfococcaceae bacterium HSG9]